MSAKIDIRLASFSVLRAVALALAEQIDQGDQSARADLEKVFQQIKGAK